MAFFLVALGFFFFLLFLLFVAFAVDLFLLGLFFAVGFDADGATRRGAAGRDGEGGAPLAAASPAPPSAGADDEDPVGQLEGLAHRARAATLVSAVASVSSQSTPRKLAMMLMSGLESSCGLLDA